MTDDRPDKAERNHIAIEAGQRMAVFMEDELVQRWFAKEREMLMSDMMSDPLDKDRIQSFIMAIRTLDNLKAAMENAVTIASRLNKEVENDA